MKTLLFILPLSFNILFGQISVTKVASEKKNVDVESKYDSTKNFLGDNPYAYKGQELYLKGKSESLRKFGYRNFIKDYRVSSTLNKDNVYKCCESFNSNYDSLAGQYFTVVNVLKHPKSKQNKYLYGSKFYLELMDSNNEKFYYEYDSKYAHTFPFIVTSFYNYVNKNVTGKKFHFKNSMFSEALDLKTGEKINSDFNTVWTCKGLTIESRYYSLSLLLENEKGTQTTISYSSLMSKYNKGKIFTEKGVAAYKKKFGATNWSKIVEEKIVVGFTKEMVRLSWGEPKKINRASYGDQWVYDSQYLYFTGNKLKSFN